MWLHREDIIMESNNHLLLKLAGLQYFRQRGYQFVMTEYGCHYGIIDVMAIKIKSTRDTFSSGNVLDIAIGEVKVSMSDFKSKSMESKFRPSRATIEGQSFLANYHYIIAPKELIGAGDFIRDGRDYSHWGLLEARFLYKKYLYKKAVARAKAPDLVSVFNAKRRRLEGNTDAKFRYFTRKALWRLGDAESKAISERLWRIALRD